MKTSTKVFIGLITVSFCALFYLTPYLALYNMKSAAEDRNAAKLSSHVNFPALKDSIKATINSKIATETKGKNPYGELGAVFAAALIGPLVDTLVSPENLAKLFEGEKPQIATKKETPSPAESESKSKPDISMKYESYDQFVVNIKNKDSLSDPLGLILIRDGLFSWKLSGLRMPI
jgi:Protein of unknown function (DUF2939)